MNNNEKLDFIVRYERKQKIKMILKWIAVMLFAGAVLIYFQIQNFQSV
ncbi:MAG: hypothetical protein OEX07_16015 [Gammaproteobacteria bacterium]|nr:hypothetical protein [Gammaproteobacteria bacterium]